MYKKEFRFGGTAKIPNLQAEQCWVLGDATSMEHLEEITGELGFGSAKNIKMKNKTIGLNMIVKNEEKVIKKALDSAAPLVDYYLIVDTGSTDNTIKIIEETMKGHGIPGKVVEAEWTNFCDARNRALKEIEGKTDWVFWLDADETLEIVTGFSKSKMSKQLEGMTIGESMVDYETSRYTRCQWLINDGSRKWAGAVHEVPNNDEGKTCIVSDITTIVKRGSASWGDNSKEFVIKKYKEHAELLLEYIKENNDPRWVFYLAQSYRDAHMYEESIKWYKKRVEMEGGYWEERYISQLMVGTLMGYLKKPVGERINELAKCSMLDPNRAEHFVQMIQLYQSEKNWIMAYALGNYAWNNIGKNPFPKSRLFLNHLTYERGLLDVHILSVSYLKKNYELKRLLPELEKIRHLFPDRERIEKNIQWFRKQLGPLAARI